MEGAHRNPTKMGEALIFDRCFHIDPRICLLLVDFDWTSLDLWNRLPLLSYSVQKPAGEGKPRVWRSPPAFLLLTFLTLLVGGDIASRPSSDLWRSYLHRLILHQETPRQNCHRVQRCFFMETSSPWSSCRDQNWRDSLTASSGNLALSKHPQNREENARNQGKRFTLLYLLR